VEGAKRSHVATSEIATLDHELGNDPVEARTLVSEALLASAESTKVLGRLWDIFIEKVEHDAFRFGWIITQTGAKVSIKSTQLARWMMTSAESRT
jgi:hypothetical protein